VRTGVWPFGDDVVARNNAHDIRLAGNEGSPRTLHELLVREISSPLDDSCPRVADRADVASQRAGVDAR
jgi:hypothetical protein